MTIGESPAATSVAAARMPAGPAPTMTGGLSIAAEARDDPHAIGEEGRAGPEPLAILQRDPAILAGAHQAKPGARLADELVVAHPPAIGQQRGEERVAGKRLAGHAVDAEADDLTAAL